MQRVLNLWSVAIAVLAAVAPTSVHAQSQPTALREIDRSLSWCAAPAAKPEWARQLINLNLEEERDSAGTKRRSMRLPPPHLAELLQGVREQFRSAPAVSGLFSENGTLLAADTHYRVQALWGSVEFQWRGDGTVDSLVLHDVRDSTFFTQLATALRTASRPGALTPFGARTDIRRLTLKPAMHASDTGATWTMFTMEVPRERPVRIVRRPSLSYPPAAQGWRADITLEFYVDTAGKAEPRTIVTVPAPEDIVWTDAASKEAYRQFVAVSRRGVERTKFASAEFLGCRYRRLVSQPLTFEVMPPL